MSDNKQRQGISEAVLTGVGFIIACVAAGSICKRAIDSAHRFLHLMEDQTTEDQRSYEHYLELRKGFEDSYSKGMGQYDRLIPWGGGGALVLSMTFLNTFKSGVSAESLWYLGAAWTALILSISSSIISQYTSSRIFKRRIHLLDKKQMAKPVDSDAEEFKTKMQELEKQIGRWNRLTWILNPVAGLFLIVGISMLALFALTNVPTKGG